MTDIIAKSKNFKMPADKSGVITAVDGEIPMYAHPIQARRNDGITGAETALLFSQEYPELVRRSESRLPVESLPRPHRKSFYEMLRCTCRQIASIQ